jgi:hypothetical protein
VTRRGADDPEQQLGWGGILIEEEHEVKEMFEKKYGSDHEAWFKCWPQSFRWTCCGNDGAEGMHNCDHHGAPGAPARCTCDFCRAGRPLPDDLWQRQQRSQARQRLQLQRGPDGCSQDAAGMLNFQLRQMFGF